ncbi:MAG: hypothetical protein QNJ53_05680 [Pleurocapsa sp. MO_192.B19]|nr:hypothetical protein [Pleurocapsa sp. MO_192.B19]
MLKRFVAPIVILTVMLMQITISSVSANDSTQLNEGDRNYFIKPIPQSNVVVVEPNYRSYFHPDKTIQGDASGEVLYTALDELSENYNLGQTQMIRFERKGIMIPNLYVRINEDNSNIRLDDELIADELLIE